MSESRTKNSIINVILAISSQVISLIASYVIRLFFVRNLAKEYLGINGLFTNILTVFSLAELGIGGAIIYAMYKPIADNNIEKIKSYMKFYKQSYRIIAGVIFIIGIMILPNLNIFINLSDAKSINNLEIIYLLYLLDSVFSYLCIYKISLLNAMQKNYIYNLYQTIGKIISTVLMCIVLVLYKNFIIYLFIQVFFKLLVNIVTSFKATKMYKYLNDKNVEKLGKEEKKGIIKSVIGVFSNQVGYVIINGTDNIIISKFVNLMTVGFYSNYYMIIGALSNFIGQIFTAVIASVGNYNAKESKENVFKLFKKIDLINFLIVSFVVIEMIACINTFIGFSFGNEYVLDNMVVFIIIVNFYFSAIKNSVGTFKNSLGIFWEDKYSAVSRAIINLFISIILVIKYGLIGVFLRNIN